VLLDQPARHRLHQQDGVLGYRGRIGAAVVAHRDAVLARGGDVRAVVAGAQQLDQLEFRRRLVELLLHLVVDEADEVFGVLQRRGVFGAAGRGGDYVVALRRHLQCQRVVALRQHDGDDLWIHGRTSRASGGR
jgi:hypothetical protein